MKTMTTKRNTFPTCDGWLHIDATLKSKTPLSEDQIKEIVSFGKPTSEYEWGKVEQYGSRIKVIMRSKPAQWAVYRMNDCDWWLARTREEAIVGYLRDVGCEVSDNPTPEEIYAFEGAEIDDPQPLSGEDMDRLIFRDGDGSPDDPRRSFREQLALEIAAGPKVKMFASRES